MSHYVTHQVPAVDTSQLLSKTLPGLTSGFKTCTGVLGTDCYKLVLLILFFFSSLLVVTCFFLFLYLLNMQENMSCQTHV
jgi:hypothetical protein